MAGSWNHSVANDGQLLNSSDLRVMLENGGDVWEYAEECYGMVWYLAKQLSVCIGVPVEQLIEEARTHYSQGVEESPGVEGVLPDEEGV